MSPEHKNGMYSHSVGELLKSAREARNLTLTDVHKETKMSLPVLEALEQDDFGSFESEIYLKGFLKNYARYLGLDADQVIGRLEGQRGGASVPRGGHTLMIEESIKEERLKSPRILTRYVLPALLVIIVILAVLLALERRKVQELRSNLRQVGQTTEAVESRPA